MDLSVVPYTGGREEEAEGAGGGGGGGARYRECLRNHAAAMGGQAYDGCGEFMPAGEEGSLDALKCAACGCHRNFHRREGLSVAGPRQPLLLYGPGASAAAAAWDHSKLGQQPPPPQFPAFLPAPMPLPYHAMQPPPLAAALPLPPCQEAGPDRACRVGSETPPRREEAAAEASGSRKRFRTRFTAEQKEKMQAFAEKLGWRVQKQDDVALDEFCLQIGVKRHVLKVWMHNNKSHLSSSSSSSSASHSATADPATRDAASASASASAPPIHA